MKYILHLMHKHISIFHKHENATIVPCAMCASTGLKTRVAQQEDSAEKQESCTSHAVINDVSRLEHHPPIEELETCTLAARLKTRLTERLIHGTTEMQRDGGGANRSGEEAGIHHETDA